MREASLYILGRKRGRSEFFPVGHIRGYAKSEIRVNRDVGVLIRKCLRVDETERDWLWSIQGGAKGSGYITPLPKHLKYVAISGSI